jgi:hypothetical protein
VCLCLEFFKAKTNFNKTFLHIGVQIDTVMYDSRTESNEQHPFVYAPAT